MDPATVALPTDVASGATDPILEHTIRSAALALRTLSDMARLGKSHERSARDAYTRLEILERVQQQPQPQMNVNYQASFSAASYHAPY